MNTHLHFTFGPVQGFVAQARRTRDLFSGSFLLSHLSLTAMQTAKNNGGEILLPNLDTLEKLLATDPKHAGAPNRFVAKFSDEKQAGDAARVATKALQCEWEKIADAVYGKYIDNTDANAASLGNGTSEIWDRQIKNFWEIAWVVGLPDEKGNPDGRFLDRRKNWRTPPTTIEGGDHCSLMGQYQEISGYIRSQQRREQDDFWNAVRKNMHPKTGATLNLEPGERLCAIALIKRFFPDVAKRVIGRELDASSWPSTLDIAATKFRRHIKGDDIPSEFPEFTSLHPGNYLNRTALKNKSDTPMRDGDEHRRAQLIAALKKLEDATSDRAGNFYALLLMDGDNMGKLIRKLGAGKITAALTEFSSKIPSTVCNYDGTTVYAGGDDLFALLPLDRALACAADAAKLYKKTFTGKGITDTNATISAAVVFAHYRVPLRQVIAYAHHLLDDVAKDKTNRDAIAISILKPGGKTCQWAARFNKFAPANSAENKNIFSPLIEKFHDDGNGIDTLSSRFLYNLRRRFAELADSGGIDIGEFTEDNIIKLFTAELVHGRLDKDPVKAERQRRDATTLIKQLVTVCTDEKHTLTFDGTRLVRFLALDGKEGNE
ncbi:MAG: type III-B CRISPR-associated protein Cas10/Cmr2 [Opitutaceae bacterium]|jgi:CRISPR-associated protein Cmr2|nr:type III-B CRISPR-associated protein Cas10/Cmr2 [Opitutaceae bacterium]